MTTTFVAAGLGGGSGSGDHKSVDNHLGSLMVKAGILSSEEINSAIEISERTAQPLWAVILREKNVPEDLFASTIAQHANFPLIKIAATNIDPEAVVRIPETLAAKFTCIPLKFDDGTSGMGQTRRRRPALVVAMVNPTDLQTLLDLEFSTGLSIQPAVATRTEIEDAITRTYHTDQWLESFLEKLPTRDELQIEGDDDENDVDPKRDFHKIPAVKLVNSIINQAIKDGASDIHIEPGLNELHVRYRQDGLLKEVMKAPKWLHEPLVSRLKILAKLDIAERRRPQDGVLRVKQGSNEVDLRISTLPTHFGEKAVVRVLGSSQTIPTLASLGLGKGLEILDQAIAQPQGLVLVTGPTGSGKTTTLYSMINAKRDPAVNIVTVEDPIEFHLQGINQVQVNNKAGVTFASSLRSILRQDPDVILVGEIRDLETAEISFHAANTGHLVLSTLHTNSSVATLSRLIDLGMDPYLIASSINVIMAQRLVRKICLQCKEAYQPDPLLVRRLSLPAGHTGFYHGRGCAACNQSGYQGRVGIYEILRITPALRKLIAAKAPESELRVAALTSGTTMLLQAAIGHIQEGVTTVEEVLRVIQIQEDGLVPCVKCGILINPEFCVCPYCLYALRRACRACRQELKPEWRVCPYCSSAVQDVAIEPATEAPVAVPPMSSEAPALVSPSVDLVIGKKLRILVVDDDVVCRRLAVKALEKLDLQPAVSEAKNGPEALAAIAESQPDLVVLDVMMPGLSGFDVCEKLRTSVETAFIPILMLTANIDEDSRTKGFLVGTDDYMGKPFSVPELHVRVKRLLRRTYGF